MTTLFEIGGYVVDPAHGVGTLLNKNTQIIVGKEIECFEVLFEQDNLRMMVPTSRMEKRGIRHLITKEYVEKVYDALREPTKGFRVIWNKRSREFMKKILTGDVLMISEVIKDLYRNIYNPSRSYSERSIYEMALGRVASEIAVVTGATKQVAEAKIVDILSKYHETYQEDAEHDIGKIEPESLDSIDSLESSVA